MPTENDGLTRSVTSAEEKTTNDGPYRSNPLEDKFEAIFNRLEAIEKTLECLKKHTHGNSRIVFCSSCGARHSLLTTPWSGFTCGECKKTMETPKA